MVLMMKGNTAEYVPDAFVDEYHKLGFKIVGEEATAGNGGVDPDGEGKTEGKADDGSSENADEEGKFVCPHCGKEYAKQVNLDKHIAEKHAE